MNDDFCLENRISCAFGSRKRQSDDPSHVGYVSCLRHSRQRYLTQKTSYVVRHLRSGSILDPSFAKGRKMSPLTAKCQKRCWSRVMSQGSVLGTSLFLLYTADVARIVERHGINFHPYADDSELYLHVKAGEFVLTLPRIASCNDAIDMWMSSNRLKLNADRTQFIVFDRGCSFQK